MRILVIGGAGFTGPHVVRRLAELGHEIVLFHRHASGPELPAGARRLQGDRDRLAAQADTLVGLAPDVVLDMIPATGAHAAAVMQMFTGIARRVVAISSQDVYRAYGRLIGIEPGEPDPVPLCEEAPLRSRLHPYRQQVDPGHRLHDYEKILVERAYLGEPRLPGTILRYPMVYGPHDPQRRLRTYLRRMDDGRPAILVAEEMAGWRWTRGYSGNVAAAVALAVCDERAAGRTCNLGEPDALTEVEWIEAIAAAAGWSGRVVVVPRDRTPPALASGMDTRQHLVADTRRIRDELGFVEPVARDEALRRTVAWERARPAAGADAQEPDYRAEDLLLEELDLVCDPEEPEGEDLR